MKISTEQRNSETSQEADLKENVDRTDEADLKENVDRTDHMFRHQNAGWNQCSRC